MDVNSTNDHDSDGCQDRGGRGRRQRLGVRYGRPLPTVSAGRRTLTTIPTAAIPDEDDDDDNDLVLDDDCQTGDLGWTSRTPPITMETGVRTREDDTTTTTGSTTR